MADDLIAIDPTPKAAPDETSAPARFGKLNNLAGDTELTDQVQQHLSKELYRFKEQPERTKFAGPKGTMDLADRFYRVDAKRRDTASVQYQQTLSDVASSAFHRAVRAMTAGEQTIYFDGDDLPARYDPSIDTNEWTVADGREQCTYRNILEEYTFDRDKRKRKIKQGTTFKNKYGQQPWCHEWDYRKEEKRVKIKQKDGSLRWVTKKFTVADHPSIRQFSAKNFYVDASIINIRKQRTVFEEQEVAWGTLADDQREGFTMNLKDVTAGELSHGDIDTEPKDNIAANADEERSYDINGLYKRWQSWALLPIKELSTNGKPNGKGKWDNDIEPQWYWCTFVGNIGEKAVCVRMLKNPSNYNSHPYFMEYAYDDDKGFYHIAPVQLITSMYWQLTTFLNQAIDNGTLRNLAPYILQGRLVSRNAVFDKANKIIEIGKGSSLDPIQVPRTTEITMEIIDWLESKFMLTLGVTKAIEGEAVGGRQSATAHMDDLFQASKPLVQKADDNGTDFFTWVYELDAIAWDQYGDPDLVLNLTHNNNPQQIRPSEIWGPYKISVVAPTAFENKQAVRNWWNAFTQNAYPMFAGVAGKEGERVLWRKVGPMIFPKVLAADINELIPPSGDWESTNRANNESGDMLLFGTLEVGEFIEPDERENHISHLDVHRRAQANYDALPKEQQVPENSRNNRDHILIHEQMLAERDRGGVQGAPNAAVQEGTPGELAANPIEAAAGAQGGL